MRIFYLFFLMTLFFIIPFSFCGLDERTVQIDLCADSDQEHARIEEFIDQPFVLKQLTFEADVPLSAQEFADLIDVHEQQLVTPEVLFRACIYLRHKKRFKSVGITITTADRGMHMHFNLVGKWIFKNLIVDGLWVGKDQYRHQYALEPGEPFDQSKHEHAIQSLKQQLHDQGYGAACVEDTLRFDEKNKLVTVLLYIERSKISKITFFESSLSGGSLPENELLILQDLINNFLSKRLIGHDYSQKFLHIEKNVLKEYLAKQGYLQTEIDFQITTEKHAVHVFVTVHVGQKKKIIFRGNNFFSQLQLLQNIVQDQALAVLPASIIAQEVERVYKNKGFFNVDVKINQQDGQDFLTITEGARVSIEKIKIKGVRSFSSAYLIRHYFGTILRNSYDSSLIKNANNRLISYYLKKGFWDFAIIKQECIPYQKVNGHILILTIDEGVQRYIKKVLVDGYPHLTTQAPFFIAKPIPFDTQIMYEHKRWLQNYFYARGYHAAQIIPQLKEDGSEVELVWHVTLEKESITFGKTIINHVGRLPFKNIVRELCYTRGQHWDHKKIEQSLKRLRNLELFETIYCAPLPALQDEAARPIMLKLVEADPFEIRTRLGFAKVSKSLTLKDSSTFKVGGSLLWRNPINIGDQLRLDVDATLFNRTLIASYHVPWLFNFPINTQFKLFSTKYMQPTACNKSKKIFDATHDGFLVSMGYDYVHGACGFECGIDWTRICETDASVGQLPRVLEFDARLVNKRIPYVTIEPYALVDYLDDSINPTYGLFARCAIKNMLAYDTGYSFAKLLIEQSAFVPFFAMVFGLHIRFGHIFNAPFDKIIPSERFYLGGAHSLRGYEPNSAPPLKCLVNYHDAKKNQFVAQGGKTMFNANIEMRFPVYASISGVFFHDIGFLHKYDVPYGNIELLTSTGLGLRLHTPVGPLRFDIGWKWKKRYANDTPYAWFLTFGHAF